MAKIRPLGKYVLIQKQSDDEKIVNGVIVPGSGLKSSQGTVLAVGDEIDQTLLKVGDDVLFSNFATDVEDIEDVMKDRKVTLMRYMDIYAVIEKELVELIAGA